MLLGQGRRWPSRRGARFKRRVNILLLCTEIADWQAISGAAKASTIVVTYHPGETSQAVLARIADAVPPDVEAETLGWIFHGFSSRDDASQTPHSTGQPPTFADSVASCVAPNHAASR